MTQVVLALVAGRVEEVEVGASGVPTEMLADETFEIPDRTQMQMSVPILLAAGAMILLGTNSALVGVD